MSLFRFPPPGAPRRITKAKLFGLGFFAKSERTEREINRIFRTRRARELEGDIFDVLSEFREGLSVSDVEAAVLSGDARVILNAAAPNQLEAELGAAISSHLEEALEDGVEIGLRFAPPSLAGVPVSLATDAAVAAIATSASLTALGLAQTTQEGIAEILRLGITDALDPVTVAKRIGDLAGLTARDVRALENFRRATTLRFIPPDPLDPFQRLGVPLFNPDTKAARRVIDEEVEKYRKRLLLQRGRTIAETETQAAITAGERAFWDEAGRQEGPGSVNPDQVFKTWRTVRDDRVCPICEPLHGETIKLEDPFITSAGPKQGPPAHPRCRCFLQYGEIGPDGRVPRRPDAGPDAIQEQRDDRFLDPAKVDEDLAAARSGLERDRQRIASARPGSGLERTLLTQAATRGRTVASLEARQARAAAAGAAKTTEEAFKLPSGAWAPERALLHQRIFEDLEKAARQADGRPIMQLTGGGSASGKGTLLGQGKITNPPFGVLIDSDDIKRRLPEFDRMIASGDSTAAAFVHAESSAVGDQAISRALERGYNMTLDGTGDGGISKLRRRILAQKEAGYLIKADYVYLPTDEAVRRSALRAARTGRKVPELSIRATHKGVSEVVPKALEEGLFDEFRLWDNGETNDLIARKIGDGPLEILKPDTWADFLAKANEDIEKVL